ncbi:hypothetical protein B0A49_13769, partial [Cryomyces minteri]
MLYSTLLSAAFAAGVLGSPLALLKRDVVTEYDYVTVTEIVTAGAAPEATSTVQFYGHRYGQYTRQSSSPTTSTSTTITSSTTSISTTTTSRAAVATSSVAPAPVSTSSSTTTTRVSTTAAAVATSSSAAAATTTVAAASAKATDYASIVVAHHNVHRANHSAPDLVWDAGLASTAATIAAKCVYAHDVTTNGGGYGQNIAAGVRADNISAVITNLFYNGEVNYFNGLYGQANPDMTNFEKWGHFSQIVWKNTGSVGCATQDCSASGLANVGSNVAPFFTVCNYKAP